MKSTKANKWFCGILCLVGLLFLAGVMTPVEAQDKMTRKLSRKISVMERVVDEVLRDSPYLLIHSDRPTSGIYLDGYGVVFAFRASLVNSSHSFSSQLGFIKGLRDWTIDSNDDRVIIHYGDDDEHYYLDDEDEELYEDEDEEEYREDAKKWRSRRDKKDKRRYERGREELVEALIDYGGSLPGLADNEWVIIAASLQGDDFFKDNNCSHLLVKARVRDLDADLSEEEMKERVIIEEY